MIETSADPEEQRVSNDEGFRAPGVYVDEMSPPPPPIAAASTTVVAFVGTPSQLPDDDPDTPRPVTSAGDYERSYGRLDDGSMLAIAVRGFFENGGRSAFIVPVDAGSLGSAIDRLEIPDDVSTMVTPDLMATYVDADGVVDTAAWTSAQAAVLARCERDQRMYILDPPPKLTPNEVVGWRTDAGFDSAYGALYYPWLSIVDPTDPRSTVEVPPSGFVAGVWARTDTARGVWKAPANEVVRSIVGLVTDVSAADQEDLNPIGINAIRALDGRGPRVWGARTLSTDVTWHYINVRRLITMITTSVEDGTRWVVFEPNDMALWQRVTRNVEQFLSGLWRNGALFAATEDEAFFVRCDEATNPAVRRDAGLLTIEIGVAPIKPAEFVIFRVIQRGLEHTLVTPGPLGPAAPSVTLEIDGTVVDGFTTVRGLGHDTEVIEHRDGGDPSTAPSRRLVGRHMPGEIVLTRTLATHPYLTDWFEDVRDDNTTTHRRNGAVVIAATDGAELARWNFVNGWPRSSTIGEIGAGSLDSVRETIVLVHEGLTRAV